MREPNLDPNGCTEILFTGFKYLKNKPTNNKGEWVKTQLADPVLLEGILQQVDKPYPLLRDKYIWDGKNYETRNQQKYNYCKMFLERKYDEIFN
jgi:hypothetical protein